MVDRKVGKGKAQQWQVGSVFVIPLLDGSGCIAQVVGRERQILNSVTIAIHDVRQSAMAECVPALRSDDVFSMLLSTKDLLDSGRWKVVGVGGAQGEDATPYEGLRSSGFIGAKVRGSALVEDFVNAFYGLAPWDDWYVPNYLDEYLISPDKKPSERLKFCGRHSSAASSDG